MLPVQHGGRHRLVGGTLVVKTVQPDDRGRYLCRVNNSLGLSESHTELSFREKLQARIEPHVLFVDADQSVVLTCTWSGSPR